MSIFSYLFGDGTEAKSARPFQEVIQEIAADQSAYDGFGTLNEDALEATAVLAAVRVIANGIAQVPFKLLQKQKNDRGEEASFHPLAALLRHTPNDWQTSYELREQMAFHLILTGNAFCFLNRHNRTKEILEIYAFEPGSVTVTQNADYTLSYRVQTGKRKTIDFIDVPAENMWHIKGPSWNGWMGLNATKLARQAIGLSLASEKFGANLFKNGARPGGILSTEAVLTPEQRQQLKEAWNEQQAGSKNAHKTAVLGGGMKFQPISSTANEAQWTESRKFQIQEICRAFGVQPVMLMADGATSYNSVEQLLLAHLTHTLMPWFERIEQSAYKALLSKEEKQQGYYIKLDSRALLESSTADRLAYYNQGRTQGWLTINEVRALEDLPRSDDPLADKLTPAANLFGQTATPTPPTTTETQGEEPNAN
ncbi:phage portal protein [Sphingobium xenophagum]|uniref:phage portal protein n=1 Tax=Sphingobium xenophagum TaxID=121428 RepID=UPI001C0C955B|nr:phage portal protein [Sphingobium xenophagum]QWT15313.1 phage portal protein [Sphingobium xenophagum]